MAVDVKTKVAESICSMYGIPFVTSNYNFLAKRIGEKHE